MLKMATKDEVLTENEDDIEVVEVDVAPGEEAKAQEAAAKDEKSDDVDDQTTDDDADDDEDKEDARLADQDADPEERNEQEREKRVKRRQRQKEARDRTLARVEALERQNQELLRRLGGVETTQQSSTEAQLDSRLADVRKDIATADAIMAQALKDGNGDDFVAAQTLRDQAKDQERELVSAKKTFEAKPADNNDAVRQLADRWKQANSSWYGAPGYEQQTAIANGIDAQVMQDGYDPKTPAYYQELTRRLKALRSDDEERPVRRKETHVDESPRRRAPPLGASRDSAGANGKRQVHLSRERVEAIKAAGAWDDPKERAALIKAYEEYDREHSAAAR